jgi:CRISPR/Cas system-associated exonuclease Cas4 (RecB family)
MIRLSNTKLEAYSNCPHKYKLAYIDKCAGVEVKHTSFEVGKLIHKVMEHYREGLDILELYNIYKKTYVVSDFDESIMKDMIVTAKEYYEPYVGCMYDSEKSMDAIINSSVTLTGIIDKIYYHNPDFPKEGKYRVSVIDYKTGVRKYNNATQMKFYFALIYKMMGVLPEEIECKVFYLRLKEIITYEFDLPDINEFITYVGMVSEIMENRQVYTHKIGRHCEFCKFSHGDCTYYNEYKVKHGL